LSGNSLISDVLDSPRAIGSILVSMVFLYFSVLVSGVAIVVVLALCAIRQFCHLPQAIEICLIIVGGILMGLDFWVLGINGSTIHLQNINLIYNTFSWQYVLCALPFGLSIGAVFSLALPVVFRKTTKAKIKHLAKGKISAEDALLSEKQIDIKMSKLDTASSDGIVLGLNQQIGVAIELKDRHANAHTLIVGTTGAGKTTCVGNIIESCIKRKLPLIYVDGKGDLELAANVQQAAEQNHRPFYIFSMSSNPKIKSHKYNPLKTGGYTSKKDRIIELRQWSEDHYRKINEGYLQTVFKILEDCNIVVDLRTLAKYLRVDALYQLARDNKNVDVRKIDLIADNAQDVSSLLSEIENMANSEIGELFNCSSGKVLCLEDAIAENAIVYFCLQPLSFPAYAESLGKLIINDLKALAASYLNRSMRKNIYCIFDEFSVFAGDQIINLINQGRSAGIHAIFSTQGLGDLNSVGDSFRQQVISNCNNFIIMRQNDSEDAETIAAIIGTKDTIALTSQVSEQTGTGSVRQTKEFIIHPDQIKRLRMGQAIFLNKIEFNVSFLKVRQNSIGN
jgi:conjugal transfer pilus assembly protein TraD